MHVILLSLFLITPTTHASTHLTISTSHDYSGQGSLESVAARGSAAYLGALRRDYKFRVTNGGTPANALAGEETYWPYLYQIDIRIEPCANTTLTGTLGVCCSGTGAANCGDKKDGIIAGPDLKFAYIQNAHISNCAGTDFEDDPNCGTFIEVHRATSAVASASLTEDVAEILADVQLASGEGTFVATHVATSMLCTGDYELWWVVRTRSGPYVQFRKSFTVLSPSCKAPPNS